MVYITKVNSSAASELLSRLFFTSPLCANEVRLGNYLIRICLRPCLGGPHNNR